MTFWDIINANTTEPVSGIMKLFFKIIMFFTYNWFWIKWIVFAALIVMLAIAIRKHNKKVDAQQKDQ